MQANFRRILHHFLKNEGKTFCTTSTILSKPFTKVSEVDGVREITLCGPARNALSVNMMEDIIKNITRNQDDINLRVIVLKAEGPIFSAGHNLKELNSDSTDVYRAVFKTASKMMLSILHCPVPVVASVHGLAAAAGCQLVAGCDIAICSENASFSTPGAQVGIFCSTPGVALVRAVPSKIAADMLFTGETISAQKALQYGLVSRVAPEADLDEELFKVTSSICSKSRSVIELGKKFLHSQIQQDIFTAYRLGENVMISNVSMADAQEGMHSFLSKRKPQWKHTSE